jgi:hypothetical protein
MHLLVLYDGSFFQVALPLAVVPSIKTSEVNLQPKARHMELQFTDVSDASPPTVPTALQESGLRSVCGTEANSRSGSVDIPRLTYNANTFVEIGTRVIDPDVLSEVYFLPASLINQGVGWRDWFRSRRPVG